jgi:hypothetical protein
MQNNTRVRALCCECGNLRTVSARYRRRDDAHSRDSGADARGWRMTATLRCSACGSGTVHALLRDDVPGFRDSAEERQWLTREQLMSLSSEITDRLALDDLTTDELRQLVAILVAVEARLEAATDE